MPRHGSPMPASSLGDAMLLDALLAHVPGGAAAFDDDLRCVRANAMFTELTGVAAGATLGCPEEDELAATVAGALRSREPSGPARLGGAEDVEVSAFAIREDDGVAGVLV